MNTRNDMRTLLRSDLSEWSDSRLNVWCCHLPMIMLCALTIAGEPTQEGLPRAKGPYTMADLHSVLHYAVLADIEASPEAWRQLGRWALRVLYPEYRRRKGCAHACEARMFWLGATHSGTADRVLGYHGAA